MKSSISFFIVCSNSGYWFSTDVAQTYLGGEKERITSLEAVDQLADDGFRRAVGRRGIDHFAAQFSEPANRFSQRRLFRLDLDLFVAPRGADTDDGNAL